MKPKNPFARPALAGSRTAAARPARRKTPGRAWAAAAFVWLLVGAVLLVPYGAKADSVTTMSATLPSPREGTSAVWDSSRGSAYIFGGYNNGVLSNQVVKYQPGSNSVSVVATLPGPMTDTASVWTGSVAYIFGGGSGGNPANKILRFDPATNTVTTMSAVLPNSVWGPAAIWDGSKAYIFGGRNDADTGSYVDIVRYDPATNTVATMSATIQWGTAHAGAVWTGTYAYIFGGESGYYKHEIYRYHPATDTIARMPVDLPTGSAFNTAVWDGSKAYVFGGYGGWYGTQDCREICNEIRQYDPAANTVTVVEVRLPQPLMGASSIWDGSNAYVFGGTTAYSGWTSQILKYDLTDPPTEPRNLVANAGPGAGQIKLDWQAPLSNGGAAVTAYKVYRGTSSGSLSLVTSGGCANLGNVLTCTDSSLGDGVTRYYKVSAVNPAGESPQSNQDDATTFTFVPTAPRDLVANAGPSAGQIKLDWQAPLSNGGAAVTAYKVYRGTSSGSLSLVTSGGCANLGNVLTCTDSNLGNAATRYYKVSAINSVGESPQSNQDDATTFVVVPSAPLNLAANAGPGAGQIKLDWQAPSSNGGSAITSYKVYRGTSSGGETFLATVAGNVLTYTDSNLGNAATRYYKVSAVNSAGEGPRSNGDDATTFVLAPSAPRSLVATGGPEPGEIRLDWQAPADNGGGHVANYAIYRGEASGAETYLTTVGDVRTWTDTGLRNGEQRFYKVTAINSAGESPPSNEANATTPSPLEDLLTDTDNDGHDTVPELQENSDPTDGESKPGEDDDCDGKDNSEEWDFLAAKGIPHPILLIEGDNWVEVDPATGGFSVNPPTISSDMEPFSQCP